MLPSAYGIEKDEANYYDGDNTCNRPQNHVDIQLLAGDWKWHHIQQSLLQENNTRFHTLLCKYTAYYIGADRIVAAKKGPNVSFFCCW